MTDLISITVADGKYTIRQTAPGRWECLRHGELWTGIGSPGRPDNVHVALAFALHAANGELTEIRRTRIGDAEISGALLCRAEKAEASRDDLLQHLKGALELIEKHVPADALGSDWMGDPDVPGGVRGWAVLVEHTHYIRKSITAAEEQTGGAA